MTDKPQVYLFDFWLTLGESLSEDPIATFYRQLGLPGATSDEFMRACLTTNISRPKRFVDSIAGTFGVTATETVYRQFRELIKSERMRLKLFAETHATLSALRDQGARIGIVSNLWAFPVNAIFARNKLAQYFEHTIFSFEVGFKKPDASIFLEACARFGVEPSQCLMIGDSLSSDIAGARAIGMPTVLIWRNETLPTSLPEGTRVIKSLSELI
jgi:HAD superfamily hydrolase (TIGR01509 family)